MTTECYSLQSVKVRGLRKPRWHVTLAGVVVETLDTRPEADVWAQRHSCHYSPLHTLQGVPAVTVVDCGRLVGQTQACAECAG